MMWIIKNKLKFKKKSQGSATYAHLMSWMEERCFSEKKKFYNDANQTENFTGAKTGNDLYYMGEKHY